MSDADTFEEHFSRARACGRLLHVADRDGLNESSSGDMNASPAACGVSVIEVGTMTRDRVATQGNPNGESA